MEIIHQILIESVSGGVETFLAYWLLIGTAMLVVAQGVEGFYSFILEFCNRFWRYWNIRKHGYPPKHCDADGDFKEEKDE